MADPLVGVLLMAYGTPDNVAQVEAYYTHIRRGRVPTPEAVNRLQQRYQRIGGRTPLLDITRAVQAALEAELNRRRGVDWRVYSGMKHWHPFIDDVMAQMMADGVRRLIAVALAPHYSQISIGGYRKAVEAAHRELGEPFEISFVEDWSLQPELVSLIASHIRDALAEFPAQVRKSVVTVFTAHSLPERIRQWQDPYESRLLTSSAAVAQEAGVANWHFAWQSAGHTGEPWLGPDIVECLETLRGRGGRHVLVVPIGFVSDHLEILYDIDIEAQDRARELGIQLRRTALPNAKPEFISALAAVVTGVLTAPAAAVAGAAG